MSTNQTNKIQLGITQIVQTIALMFGYLAVFLVGQILLGEEYGQVLS